MRLLSITIICAVVFIVGCTPTQSLSSFGTAQPKDVPSFAKDTLTVLSWNVEHFVDEHDNPYIRNKREDNPRDVKERTELLVKAIRKADADIIVLQEFESAPFLKAIRDKYLKDMGYKFVADAESDNWYMNVVLMSRVPLGVLYSYGHVTTPARYIDKDVEKYETQSRINTRMWSMDIQVHEDFKFVLSGVHLKAGRRSRDVAMRKGQINFLKGQFDRFLQEDKKNKTLLVGDFNCTPDSEEFKLMLDGGFKTQFADLLPASTLSHPADKPRWRIDHILPNQNLKSKVVDISIPYFFDKTTQRKVSDHLPVVAKILVR